MEINDKQDILYCPYCGSENKYSSEFCFCCGHELATVRTEIEETERQRIAALAKKEETKANANRQKEITAKKGRGSSRLYLMSFLLIGICIILIFAVHGLNNKEEDLLSGNPTTDQSSKIVEAMDFAPEGIYAESTSSMDESAESIPLVHHYQIGMASVDYSDYPYINIQIEACDETGMPVGETSELTASAQNEQNLMTLVSMQSVGGGGYDLEFCVSSTATVYDLMNPQDIRVSFNGIYAENTITINPGKEMMTQMMQGFHNAFIEDINAHSLNQMLDYMETEVDYNDHAALFNQMRIEITNGFLKSIAQSLQSCQVTDVYAEDENTFHVNVTLKIDGVFEEPYEVWRNESSAISSAITEFLGTVSDSTNIRLYSYVTEYCEYLVRKSGDGTYKIYCYTGDISLAKKWQVYNAQVVS